MLNDVDEGYVHRVRPRRASDMSISVQGPAAPQRTPAPPYVVSRDKPRSGPVESYASPEHRQQQAQARRAAAARVAAQREDSSDLAPEHPTRITPRNRSSVGSSRSDLIPGRMSLGTAPRTSTGSGDHLARFETGDY